MRPRRFAPAMAWLAVALIAGCGGGAAKTNRSEALAPSSSSSAAVPGATPSASAGAGGAPAAGTAAQAPDQAPAVPGALHLPRPGTYRATTTKDGSSSAVTLKYDVGSSTSSGTPVTDTFTNSNGSQLINSYSWRAGGIYLLESSIVSNGQRYDCPFDSPFLQAPTPFQVGRHWTSSGTCHTAPPSSASTNVSLSATLVGTAWQTVGGQRVATYEIKGTLETEVSGTTSGLTAGPYDFKSTAQLDEFFDPASGLDVLDISNNSSSAGSGTATNTTTETRLLSLKPS